MYTGIAILIALFAFIFYVMVILMLTLGNPNTKIPPIVTAFTKNIFIFLIATLVFIPFLMVGTRFARRVYMDAVGKVFEITMLKSSYRGLSRFQGMNIPIQTPDTLAVGDRVKVTAYDTQFSGRSRIMILVGKKLSPGDPDYDSVVQPGMMTDQFVSN